MIHTINTAAGPNFQAEDIATQQLFRHITAMRTMGAAAEANEWTQDYLAAVRRADLSAAARLAKLEGLARRAGRAADEIDAER
jgi:hypothetical protein